MNLASFVTTYNLLHAWALLHSAFLLAWQVTPKSKSNLRNFRTHAGIDAQAHLLTVEKEVLLYDTIRRAHGVE